MSIPQTIIFSKKCLTCGFCFKAIVKEIRSYSRELYDSQYLCQFNFTLFDKSTCFLNFMVRPCVIISSFISEDWKSYYHVLCSTLARIELEHGSQIQYLWLLSERIINEVIKHNLALP